MGHYKHFLLVMLQSWYQKTAQSLMYTCAYFSVTFFQERAIEGQPLGVRTEPAEEPDSNGECDCGLKVVS